MLDLVDELIEIPCLGFKNSLNIASACSAVAFEVLRQWGALGSESPNPEPRRSLDSDPLHLESAEGLRKSQLRDTCAALPDWIGTWEFHEQAEAG